MLWSKCSCKKFIFHLQSQKSTETAIEIWLSITENRPDRRIDNINLDLSDAEEVKAPLSIAIRPCSVGQGGQCRGVDSKGIVRNNSCKGQMTCSWKWAASLYVVTFPFRRPPFTPTSTEGSSKTPQMTTYLHTLTWTRPMLIGNIRKAVPTNKQSSGPTRLSDLFVCSTQRQRYWNS